MTNDELKAIEQRAEAATEGPWTVQYNSFQGEEPYVDGIGSPGEYDDIVQTDSGLYGPHGGDAEFIAAARTDVPALVAEVRRLQQENQRLREEKSANEPGRTNGNV